MGGEDEDDVCLEDYEVPIGRLVEVGPAANSNEGELDRHDYQVGEQSADDA